MPLRRFFVPRDAIRNGTATLAPDQAHYLRHVLRLNAGQAVEVFDGEGSAYRGEIEICGTEVRLVHLAASPAQDRCDSPSIVLAAALVKPDRFDWIIQKATELGIDDFVPLQTRHSSIRIPESKMASRLERWRRIAQEAARQSCRNTLPRVHEAMSFRDFLARDPFDGHAKYLCYEKGDAAWHQGLLGYSRIVLCIGPEGGWDEAEVRAAAESGYRAFSLGPRILRAETAAVVAITLFQLRLAQRGVHL